MNSVDVIIHNFFLSCSLLFFFFRLISIICLNYGWMFRIWVLLKPYLLKNEFLSTLCSIFSLNCLLPFLYTSAVFPFLNVSVAGFILDEQHWITTDFMWSSFYRVVWPIVSESCGDKLADCGQQFCFQLLVVWYIIHDMQMVLLATVRNNLLQTSVLAHVFLFTVRQKN